jgi:DNA polymerase-3 subunit gamma/tau
MRNSEEEKANMSYLVLARKWRPAGFDDLVGQEPIMRVLKNAVSQGKIAHAYLFSGPRGVGKTSSARILAKALNCAEGPTPVPCGRCSSCTAIADGSSVDVIEIDGASNNSVDDIRDLRDRVKYAPSSGRYKVYIIDEVHMLSGSAFNALLKTLEEPPGHVIFVLATTEMKKIPATVVSRCQHMPFRRIPTSVIKARLAQIAGAEGIGISSQAMGLVARAAEGSMRDSLTILDQLSSFSTDISEDDVKSLLGIADFGMLAKVARAVVGGDREGVLSAIEVLSEQGADIRSFAKELVRFFRDLLVASIMRQPDDLLDMGGDEMTVVRDIISETSEDQLSLMLSEVVRAEADVRQSSSPRVALEMALIRTSFLSGMRPITEVIERIARQGGGRPQTRPEPQRTTSGASVRESKPAQPAPEEKAVESIPEPEAAADPDPGAPPVPGPAATGSEVQAEENIAEVWETTVKRLPPPLASKLSQAKIEFAKDEISVVLHGGQALFHESIGENLKAIERIVSEEAGRAVGVKLVTSGKKGVKKKDVKAQVMEAPLIKEALELFEGRIVDVTPVQDKENSD